MYHAEIIYFGGSTRANSSVMHSVSIPTPLLALWSSFGTKDVKGRRRESQVNLYKLHGQKDGRKKMSGVLTTGFVKNRVPMGR